MEFQKILNHRQLNQVNFDSSIENNSKNLFSFYKNSENVSLTALNNSPSKIQSLRW